MVYFTCNSCGDSVQKPRVSKHISYECKKKFLGVSLCCVDCHKNFDAYTYVDHTKCVSELERYSGNNFVTKASSNKGEKKQGSWIDTVRSVLNQPALTRQQRQFLEVISQFENVPRKKQKFQNFVRSSVRSIRVFPDVVDSVFDLLEKEFKKSAAVPNAPESKGPSEATKDSTIDEKPKGNIEKERDLKEEKSNDKLSVNGEQILPEKKKKKRKIETQDENVNSDDPENDGEVMKKKKKTEENDNVILKNGEHVPDDDGEISRKKKKKRPELSNGVSCDTVETDTSREIETVEAIIPNGEDILQKKKKKKRASTIHDENSNLCDTMSNHSNTEIENTKTKEKMVNENGEITQINGEKISKRMKKRRSKALDESDAFCNDEDDDVPTDEKKLTLSNSDNQAECALHNGSNTDETVNVPKKQKKKKKQKCNEVKIADENKQSSNKRTSSKKNREQHENYCDSFNKTDEEHSLQNSENHESKSVLDEPETCGKFDWTDVVTSILSKSSSGELSLKKMEKKVVRKYHNFYGDEMNFEKIVKRLTKKIQKMTAVEVEGEKIRLRGSEL